MLILKRFWRFYLQVQMYAGLIAGPVLLVAAMAVCVSTYHFVRTARHGQGRVLALKANVDSDGDTSFAPIFRYEAEDGKTYVIESHFSSNPPPFDVGQAVDVRYSTTDPYAARIDSYWQTWGVESLLAMIAVVMILVGFALRWWFRKKARFVELAKVESARGKL